MNKVYIDAVALATPGMQSWKNALPILRGEQILNPFPLEKYKPIKLPPNETRRATELVRMAFRVCEEVMENCKIPMQECASVFASSGGDYPIIDQICRALCEKERMVSPTQFHNSVHNSAAGYWSIATGSQKPSSALSAHDASLAAGLIEAIALCVNEELPTLLVVYDIKPPYPLSEKRQITVEFGVGFLLSPIRSETSLASLSLLIKSETEAVENCQNIELEKLRLANPAARCLPLLELLAQNRKGCVALEEYFFNLEPCL